MRGRNRFAWVFQTIYMYTWDIFVTGSLYFWHFIGRDVRLSVRLTDNSSGLENFVPYPPLSAILVYMLFKNMNWLYSLKSKKNSASFDMQYYTYFFFFLWLIKRQSWLVGTMADFSMLPNFFHFVFRCTLCGVCFYVTKLPQCNHAWLVLCFFFIGVKD